MQTITQKNYKMKPLLALNLTRFKGIIKALSGMCVRLTSITFPVIRSIVLISVAWVAQLWAGHVFPNT